MKNEEIAKVLGENIRSGREALGWSQAQLGSKIKLDASRVSRVESGERTVDTVVLRSIAELFERPMESFFRSETTGSSIVLARQGVSEDAGLSAMADWAEALQCDVIFAHNEVKRLG